MTTENSTEYQESTNPPLLIAGVGGMLFLINSIRETDQYIADIYTTERKAHLSLANG